MFLGNKKNKKEMKSLMLNHYKILPYPKGIPEKYNADYKPTVQAVLF